MALCIHRHCLCALLLLLWEVSASARTIYVDSIYTGAIEAGTAAQPYRTLTGAQSAAAPGDTITLRGGAYHEQLRLNKALTHRNESGPAVIGFQRITRRVLVLNIDPVLEAQGNQRLHEFAGWRDPHTLNADYLADLSAASGGYVEWEVAAWVDLDLWPLKIDGFRYTDVTYRQSRDEPLIHPWHIPDGADYAALLDLPLAALGNKTAHQMAAAGEIDEIIWWAGPYLGFYESRMVGTTAYWCNAPPLTRNSRLYVVMGLNPEVGVAEAVHSFGHRSESILTHVYGSWSGTAAVNHLWDRFTRVQSLHGVSVNGCGNVHYPPNGLTANGDGYDYQNFNPVVSEADKWLTYPALNGANLNVSAITWGGSDYQRNFLRWWMTRFPKAPGRYLDSSNAINNGKLNNWWSYIVDMNGYAESQ